MKQTYRISSTSLSKASCCLNFHRTVGQGYREHAMSSNIVYGIAIHKFIDTMFKTGDMMAAQVAAKKAFDLPKIDDKKAMHLSDPRHMLSTCITLWTGWITDDAAFEVLTIDGVPLTEQNFSIPYYEDDHIEVFLEGTLDSIGQFKGGCYAIRDWKTTSTWDKWSYFKTYELSKQLRFYRLALKIMSEREPESTLGRIGATNVGAVIDANIIKPDMNDVEVQRSNVFQYSEQEITEFEYGLGVFIKRLSECVKNNKFHKEGIVTGSCGYGKTKCSFWSVCAASCPPEVLLKREFIQVPYTPANYNDL